MQVKLEPSEFAYLLHSLAATKVAGVNNQQLFPSELATRDALLRLGFMQLIAHGWLVARDGAIDANDYVMLMVAVVADPAYVLLATHFANRERRQTLAYYMNEGIIVEQFVAADGDYVLTGLDTPTDISTRLHAAFATLVADATAHTPLVFAADVFEQALAQARDGDHGALARALMGNNVPAHKLAALGQTIAQLRAVGHIERAAINTGKLRTWAELAIMHDEHEDSWLVWNNVQANTLELWPASAEHVTRLFGWLVQEG